MRGITGWATYLPHWRLDRSAIGAFVGKGGGRGTRTVANYDEDPVTMAVAAARRLGPQPASQGHLWFATTVPPYHEKTNATIVHAALQLDDSVGAFDIGASPRSAVGALLMAARASGSSLVVAADVRTGLAGSADEAESGDGAAALEFGDGEGDGRPVLAEVLAAVSTSAEFVDRWRTPGDSRSKSWDDKFASVTYTPLVTDAWKRALAEADLTADDVDVVAVAATSSRLASALASRLGAKRVAADHATTVGHLGAAQPAFVLASALEAAQPGEVVALVSAHDGADVLVLRATDAIARFTPGPPIAQEVDGGQALPYGKFLAWRGMLQVDPPRRPEPQRVSASAAARSTDWKFGFVGSVDPETGGVQLPPARVSTDGRRTDQMEPIAMAGALGTVATFTVDHVAYSPSPPVVFAVVDFDGGGRLPVELCDVDADAVAIGMRVEMTFRRLHTADGIHNYFWKAKPHG